MRGVTHVVHVATCKELPEIVMDVAVKGLFWLLEAFRQSGAAQQFILVAATRLSVHVEDLVDAILAALDNPAARNKLYNVCMDEPVDYGAVAAYQKETRGLDSLDISANTGRAGRTKAGPNST
jgi:hypothetical protein